MQSDVEGKPRTDRRLIIFYNGKDQVRCESKSILWNKEGRRVNGKMQLLFGGILGEWRRNASNGNVGHVDIF